MNRRPERTALRTARTRRAWSQADAARELRALARDRDGPDATAASLKTQLSRWENGHAVPEPEYRALLGELYGSSPEELGLLPEPQPVAPTAPERMRALLAAAAAVDGEVVAMWGEQLALAQRLDDELGAAGAGELVRAHVEQLHRTLDHTLSAAGRVAVASVLTGAAALAGRQALDQGDPDAAWHQHGIAMAAAHEAGSPGAMVTALVGQADVLREIDDAGAAVHLLDRAPPAGSPASGARLAAARGAAHAAAGDPDATRREFDRALHTLTVAEPADATTPDNSRPDAARPDAVRLDAAPRLASQPDLIRPRLQFEVADLHRWHGHALTVLRDPAAVETLESALAATPRAVRHRAGLHADLAIALGTAGRPADAAEHAAMARRLAERIGSRRISAQLVSARMEGW